MINYLQNNEIDREKWDACIAASSAPLVYGTSRFLDIVSPGWDGLVMNDYKAVFPLTHHRRWGFSYLRQPFFCQQLGIFSAGVVSEEILDSFFRNIPAKFRLMDINLNTSNNIHPEGYSHRKNLNLELFLQKSYPETYKFFSDNTKRNIQKAGKANLSLVSAPDTDNLIDMFRQNKGRDVKPIPESAWQMLRQIIALSLQSGTGQLWGVNDNEGRLCAGAFFLSFAKRTVFLFSAMNEKGRQSASMFKLINEFIEKNAGTGIILDFEGSNEENLARFYRGFGAKETFYLGLWKNDLPFPVRLFKKSAW